MQSSRECGCKISNFSPITKIFVPHFYILKVVNIFPPRYFVLFLESDTYLQTVVAAEKRTDSRHGRVACE